MNLFPTTTTTTTTSPTTPARVAERECKFVSRMVAHGPRRCSQRETRYLDYTRGPIMSGTHRLRSLVYHYVPARKVPFERAEIDHLPPRPDLLPSSLSLPLSPFFPYVSLVSIPFSTPFAESAISISRVSYVLEAEYREKKILHIKIKIGKETSTLQIYHDQTRLANERNFENLVQNQCKTIRFWHYNFSSWGNSLIYLTKLAAQLIPLRKNYMLVDCSKDHAVIGISEMYVRWNPT